MLRLILYRKSDFGRRIGGIDAGKGGTEAERGGYPGEIKEICLGILFLSSPSFYL